MPALSESEPIKTRPKNVSLPSNSGVHVLPISSRDLSIAPDSSIGFHNIASTSFSSNPYTLSIRHRVPMTCVLYIRQ